MSQFRGIRLTSFFFALLLTLPSAFVRAADEGQSSAIDSKVSAIDAGILEPTEVGIKDDAWFEEQFDFWADKIMEAVQYQIEVTEKKEDSWIKKKLKLWTDKIIGPLKYQLEKAVAKAKVPVNIQFYNLKPYPGFEFKGEYKGSSETSYLDGYYSRFDRYTIKNSGNTSGLLDWTTTFSLGNEVEFLFARQLKCPEDTSIYICRWETVKENPYFIKNFPINTRRAKQHLEPGDFVAYSTLLNVVVSGSAASVLTGVGSLSASAYYVISGQFLVHLFRLKNNKIRVKLIANRNRTLGFNVSSGLDFKITEIKIVDRLIKQGTKRYISLAPLAINMSKTKANVLMADYVVDLENREAAAAYDNLMMAKLALKEFQVANPFLSQTTMEKKLYRDLTAFEKIYNEDLSLPAEKRRINRIFMGSNESAITAGGFNLLLSMMNFEISHSRSDAKLQRVLENGNKEFYLLNSRYPFEKISFFFNLFGHEESATYNLLFAADSDYKPTKFIAISNLIGRKFKNLSEEDYKEIYNRLYRLLPWSIFQKIEWKPWDFSKGKLVNASYQLQLIFHKESLNAIQSVRPDVLLLLIKSKLETALQYVQGLPRSEKYLQVSNECTEKNRIDCYSKDIEMIQEKLLIIMDSSRGIQERYDNFMRLTYISAFNFISNELLLALIPESELEKVVGFTFNFSAQKSPSISTNFGNLTQDDLFKAVMYTQAIIFNRSFDLRLYTDENGEFDTGKKK